MPCDLICMGNINKTNEKTKQKQIPRYREEIGGYQWEITVGGSGPKGLKGVNCIVTDGNQTFGGEYFEMYTDVKL